MVYSTVIMVIENLTDMAYDTTAPSSRVLWYLIHIMIHVNDLLCIIILVKLHITIGSFTEIP